MLIRSISCFSSAGSVDDSDFGESSCAQRFAGEINSDSHPTAPNAKPLEKVRYPNVSLALLPTFETNLKKLFHREVPIWVTEYGYQTKPGQPHGVTNAQQAAYAKQALAFARADKEVFNNALRN